MCFKIDFRKKNGYRNKHSPRSPPGKIKDPSGARLQPLPLQFSPDRICRRFAGKIYREDDGINNIDGWSHMYISFKGERIYENPFPGLRINDDEIAVTDLLVGMKKYLETGEDIYSLRDGLQDAYLDLMREEAVISGKVIHTTDQSWT